MARKHSSKTATQEAIKNSEPRVISYRNWQGVNYVDAPLTWEPLETATGKTRQTDLPNNFLMVQNNLETSEAGGLETRMDSKLISDYYTLDHYYREEGGAAWETSNVKTTFTGVAVMYKRWLIAAARIPLQELRPSFTHDTDILLCKDLVRNTDWILINLISSQDAGESYIYSSDRTSDFYIEEINTFAGYLIVGGRIPGGSAELLIAKISNSEATLNIKGYNQIDRAYNAVNKVCGVNYVNNPSNNEFILTVKGMQGREQLPSEEDDDGSTPVRIQVCRVYTTVFGSTLAGTSASSPQYKEMYVEYSPALWNTKRYINIRSGVSTSGDQPPLPNPYGDSSINLNGPINGVDLYARENENTDWVFIGHANIRKVTRNNVEKYEWSYNWYGAMADLSHWKNSSLSLPEENTSSAVNATNFSYHDSRLYFWSSASQQYRLWIGGSPGNELSVARGLGGAWVDIESGSGYEIKGTEKWKTASGANIITIMCGHRNTNKVKRFNLVETNLTLSNEVQYKSYMYEEVSNVTGCNSRWGHGVFEDGLYSITRYGLMLVTMASEYNSQMKNQKISGVIDPIFTERIGARLRDSRMVYIDGIIYIALSEEENHSSTPTSLDNVLLCYDIGKKAWYTFTHDETLNLNSGSDPDHILGILPIDSDERAEGLGVITENQIRMYPTTGIQSASVPAFQIIMETGELIPRMPTQAFWYVQQLEFRFDYFIGDPDDPATVLIEGVDYYGRQFTIEKKLNKNGRRWQTVNENGRTGEQRAYIEHVRIDKMVESLRIRIKGKARFRLTHFNAKVYQQSDTIGTPYGFDARDTYKNRKGQDHVIHHYIDDYNNLRRAVIA